MNSSGQRIAEVERYIHELAIALSGLPADEREDVISGIREHIDDALLAIAEPTSADVRRILDDLGDPLAIAADAGARGPAAGRITTQAPEAVPAAPPTAAGAVGFTHAPVDAAKTSVPLLERDWIPAATVLAFAVASLFTVVGGPGVWFLAATLWLAGLVALISSPLWSGVEKLVGAAVFGAGPVLLAALSSIWWRLGDLPGMPSRMLSGAGNWWAVGPFVRVTMAILALALTIGTAVWLLRRGSARVSR